MSDISPVPQLWAFRPLSPEPRSVVALIREGMLDSELAATIWVLLEGHVPLIVAGEDGGLDKATLLGALLAFLPPATRVVELAGELETFDWLPQASELGWPGPATANPDGDPVRPDTTVLHAAGLSDHPPAHTWGLAARVIVRATSIGYGLAATIDAGSLDDVFDALRRPPVLLVDDELSHLGVVLILHVLDPRRRRVVAAHYVRPVARDTHGHVQRLGPAVLATWDPATDTFEQFGWGVTPELAMRVGRRPGDYEIEVDRRRDLLESLVRSGTVAPDDVRRAIAEYRPAV